MPNQRRPTSPTSPAWMELGAILTQLTDWLEPWPCPKYGAPRHPTGPPGHSPKCFMNRGSKCHFCRFLLFVPTHHLQIVMFSQLQRIASVWNKIISAHKYSGTGLWDEKWSCNGHQPAKRSTHLWNVFVGYMCHGETMATLAQECPKTMGKQKNRPISHFPCPVST